METQKLKEKYISFFLKVKKHPIIGFFILLLLFAFLFFTYTHPLNRHKILRGILPIVKAPPGTFTLIAEPDAGIAPVLALIQNAKTSIDLVMYEFEDKEIGDALIAAQKRGVAVRVLINQGYNGTEEKENEPAYAYLKSNNTPTNWTPKYFTLTHQKTLIVDKNKALIMTFNFTPKYYATSRDFGVLDTDQTDVTDIETVFNADWNDQKIIPGNGDDLVWSPGSEDDTLLIIQSAKKELDIYNEEMEDQKIVSALMTAVKHGVDVNLVVTYQSSFKSAFTELKNAGVHINLFHGEKGLYIHAKAIIADESYAFIGSENFSYTSLNQNRELGIFISDKTVLSPLVGTFKTDFQNSKPF